MGSPLVVELAVISVADVGNTALATNTYGKFVDKRNFGDFRDKSHAEGFLNSTLTDDQQYNIEYVSQDGSLPYMAVMHAGPFSVNKWQRAQNGTGAAAFGGVGDEISKIHIPI